MGRRQYREPEFREDRERELGADPNLVPGAPGSRPSTPSITKLPDGTICIGEGCSVIRVPPQGNIEIDLSDCPEDVRGQIVRRVAIDGAGTEYIPNKDARKR